VVDTFLSVGDGLEITLPAYCANGTKALVARFRGKDCDPTADPLPEPLAKVDDLGVRACVDTSELGSLAFWCDGVPGVDLGKQKTPEGKWGEAWESGVARVDARVGRTGGAWRLVLGV